MEGETTRNERITVRVKRSEREIIRREAMKMHLSETDYIRAKILSGQAALIDPDIRKLLEKLLERTNRIGREIGEMARREDRGEKASEDYRKICAFLVELTGYYRKIYLTVIKAPGGKNGNHKAITD